MPPHEVRAAFGTHEVEILTRPNSRELRENATFPATPGMCGRFLIPRRPRSTPMPKASPKTCSVWVIRSARATGGTRCTTSCSTTGSGSPNCWIESPHRRHAPLAAFRTRTPASIPTGRVRVDLALRRARSSGSAIRTCIRARTKLARGLAADRLGSGSLARADVRLSTSRPAWPTTAWSSHYNPASYDPQIGGRVTHARRERSPPSCISPTGPGPGRIAAPTHLGCARCVRV